MRARPGGLPDRFFLRCDGSGNEFQLSERAHETRREHLARLGAIFATSLGVSACAQPRAAGAPSPRDPARPLRVGLLVGAGRVQVGARGRVTATDGGSTVLRMTSGESVTVQPQANGIRAEGGGRSAQFGSLTFRAARRDALITVNGVPYRGSVAVRKGAGGVLAINEVPLEAYLQGVVAAEMGSRTSSDRAALQAQVIASRTYAIANLGRFERQGFDLRAGTTDQAYRGTQGETPLGNRAVRDTNGLVMTSDGDLVAVFFHSTCGYATASPEEVFRSVRPRAYLRSISDRSGDGYYCERSPQFRWRVEWGGAQLESILRTTVPRSLGVDQSLVTSINDVHVKTTGQSGRATEIRVRVESGEIPVFGPDVRAVFQTPEGQPLGSTAVQLSTERSNNRLARLRAAGAGWGHGVGMCQWGAIGRARAGHDFRAILSAYYPGTDISRWY